jgi:hypothetical protein
MSTHQSTVPALVADYFGIGTDAYLTEGHPVIDSTFRVDEGWKRLGYNKRISLSAVRKLRAEGVTGIVVAYHGRRADFTPTEIVRHSDRLARTPLLGGSLV